MSMGRKAALALLTLLLLLSLAMTAYPFFSNWYAERTQSRIITEYLAAASDEALEQQQAQAWEAAAAYNAQLATQVNVVTDSFVSAQSQANEAAKLLDLADTGVLCYVEVPSIGLHCPVYYGTAAATLEHGAGIVEGTSLPVGGESTHCVISGHCGLSSAKLFTDLEQLEQGDYFLLHVLGQVLTYQVDQCSVVLPDDISRIAIAPGEDYCTLLTCTPYGINSHRLLVRGTRVANLTETELEQAAATEDTEGSVWMQEYLQAICIGLGLCAVLALLFFAGRQLYKFAKKRIRT